jgi:hypothetical protein
VLGWTITDARGPTLQQNLDEWGASHADYVGLIPFLDGSSQPLCRMAKTPSSRARACVASSCRTFAEVQLKQPSIAASMVIQRVKSSCR